MTDLMEASTDSCSIDSALPPSVVSSSECLTPTKSAMIVKPTAMVTANNVSSAGMPGPETVIEYRWPPVDGEDYILQEPLAQYLGVTSFRRKFPDVFRRIADVEERRYLLHLRIITAGDETFGVTALKADDATHLMQQNFPELHAKYVTYWKQRKSEEIAAKKAKGDVASFKFDQEKMQKLTREAIMDTARWNAVLNAERKTQRSAYFDLQTYNIHYPREYPKYEKDDTYIDKMIMNHLKNQNPYRVYSPEELKYLAFKTASCGPFGVLERSDTSDPLFPDSSDSETETENEVVKPKPAKKPRTPSKRSASADSSGLSDDKGVNSPKRKSSSTVIAKEESLVSLDTFPSLSSICGICFKGSEGNKYGQFESLISCSQCTNAGHPTCLELSESIVSVILTYNWQCMECKVCMTCKSATDEENLMFCDNCDRGYHSYCVGMSEIPSGRWVCEICGDCVSCLRFKKDYGGLWKEEFTRPREKTEPKKYLQKHCDECSRKFNRGEFCPVCLKVHDASKETNEESVLNCTNCERLVHIQCDPKFAAQVRAEKLASGSSNNTRNHVSHRRKHPYTCNICRLEIEERMDSFHVRNLHEK